MSSVLVLETLAEIRAKLAADGQPVLLDFAASWCGPCKAMAPALEAFAAERQDQLTVLKVDVDEFHELASEVGVRSVPTLLLVKNGQTLAVKSGALTKQGLTDFVDRVLG